jgi:hypothetical protein
VFGCKFVECGASMRDVVREGWSRREAAPGVVFKASQIAVQGVSEPTSGMCARRARLIKLEEAC